MRSVEKKATRFFYGYIIVLVSFLIMASMYGMHNTFGVFFIPISTEFGWTRAVTSGPRSLVTIVIGSVSIVVGRLTDIFGPRLVVAVCGLFLGLGYLLMSQIGAIWHFYLFYGVMVGIGMSGAYVPLLSTAGRWFVKKRGMMSGIISAGSGVGMLVLPLVVNWLISDYGWRASFIVIGLANLLIIVSTAQFLRQDPRKMGLLTDGSIIEEESQSLEANGLSFKQAINTRKFWLLSVVYLLFTFCAMTVTTHIYPHVVDIGLSEATAASILATMGGAGIAGRFGMGSASDRIGAKLAILVVLIIMTVSLFWVQLSKEAWMLYTFAALFGFAFGGLFALLSPMIVELFGLGSHGVIFGFIYFIGTVGGSIGPVVGGHIFDIAGSYQMSFIVLTATSIVATLLTINIKE